MSKSLIVILAAFVIAGCAGTPDSPYSQYAECAVPVTRDAGMGVHVPGCEVWVFGPDAKQRVLFKERQRNLAPDGAGDGKAPR